MIQLVIADDHPIVREGLKRIVTGCTDMQVVDEAIDYEDLFVKVRDSDVDVLLLDISMPGVGFLEALSCLKAERPALKILVLSIHPEDQYALRALKAGAAGYLTKDHSPEQLADAIRKVYQGHRYITPTLAESLAADLGTARTRPLHELLSNREYEVFTKLGEGKTVTEISSELHLSPKTISTYRTRILEKTQLRNNAELMRYAIEHGLLD